MQMNQTEIETSLTAPEDRKTTPSNPWRPSQGARALTEKEVVDALTDLNQTSFVEKFPRVDRVYADPPVANQTYGLISFIPAKGASPNENGVYGYAKLRGNFATTIESNERAEYIVRNVDSYHNIFHTYVGRPFPLTTSSKYSAEVSEIDIRKQVAESISSDVKQKKMDEKREIDDMKRREENLLTESRMNSKDEIIEADPFETYITLKVKKAQLTWTFLEHQKKMAEVRRVVVGTMRSLEEMDVANPDFNARYFDKYAEARKIAGLSVDLSSKEMQDNFMKYMVEEVRVPEFESMYEETYGTSPK
jgi:hypothetical protein